MSDHSSSKTLVNSHTVRVQPPRPLKHPGDPILAGVVTGNCQDGHVLTEVLEGPPTLGGTAKDFEVCLARVVNVLSPLDHASQAPGSNQQSSPSIRAKPIGPRLLPPQTGPCDKDLNTIRSGCTALRANKKRTMSVTCMPSGPVVPHNA